MAVPGESIPRLANIAVPSVVVPSLNVTVPVVTRLESCPTTVAVKVMVSPTVGQLSEEVTVVVVVCWMVCVTVFDVLSVKVESVKTAVMSCSPPVRVLDENVATPLANVPVPSDVPPSRKVTVPVGEPLAVTVKVTDVL